METKKKVFIATGVYPPESGGPATYTKLLEEYLPAQGFAVSVLPFRVVRYLPKLLRHAAYFGKCLTRAWRADLVYAQDILSVGLPAALAALVVGKPFMVRVPGDHAWEQARQRYGVTDELDAFQIKHYGWQVELMRKLEHFVVRRAKAVVVPSEYMRTVVARWGVAPARIHRIYSSIEPPAPPQPVDRPDGFLIVSVGRNVPWKGFEALERVAARGEGWHLVIGKDIPHSEALSWIKAADVFVLNSTYEGLSHVLVEAMMLGTPIVATDVGGNPEIVEDGVTGLLVPPKDNEALYGALRRVKDDKVGAAARAAQGLARARLFTIDTAITQLVEVLKAV